MTLLPLWTKYHFHVTIQQKLESMATVQLHSFFFTYSGNAPYDHPVYKTTSLLRPYSFEDPVNATTSLLRPGFLWPNGGRINGVPLHSKQI